MKEEDKRETQSIVKGGFVYILVKVDPDVNHRKKEPMYMGMIGWALKSATKIKRTKKPNGK